MEGMQTIEKQLTLLLQEDSVTFPARVKTTLNMFLQTAFFNNRTIGEVHKLQVQSITLWH